MSIYDQTFNASFSSQHFDEVRAKEIFGELRTELKALKQACARAGVELVHEEFGGDEFLIQLNNEWSIRTGVHLGARVIRVHFFQGRTQEIEALRAAVPIEKWAAGDWQAQLVKLIELLK